MYCQETNASAYFLPNGGNSLSTVTSTWFVSLANTPSLTVNDDGDDDDIIFTAEVHYVVD